MLFENEADYKRDTGKFLLPKKFVRSVIVEGKPNQRYSQGMQPFEHYDEICKYFF